MSTGSSSSVPFPEELLCDEQVFDVACHPLGDYLAVGMVDGAIALYDYVAIADKDIEDMEPVTRFHHHTSSCRGLLFNGDGTRLYTISSDKSLWAIDGTGKSVLTINNAHDQAINKIAMIGDYGSDGGYVIATGDDAGCVKVWDTRISSTNKVSPVMEWKAQEDFISGFCYSAEHSTLLSISGDATLCSYDLRKPSKFERSDDQEAELHCVEVIKNGKKVVCGTQDGVVLVFSWGRWGDCSDRYPGHPDAVDSMLKVDENTLLTGSSDGMIRVVGMHPNKMLGVVGDHENFPVEGMKYNRDRSLLVSYSHDEVVRFWDISVLKDDDAAADNDEEMSADSEGIAVANAEGGGDDDNDNDDEDDEEEGGEGVWEDEMDDESSRFDSDSDVDDIDKKGNAKRLPSKTEKFFADL